MEKIKRKRMNVNSMNVNSWWRNLNNSFAKYSTHVDKLSKIATGVKSRKPGEILTNLEKLKQYLQEDLSNLRGQLVTYCCTDEVKSNLPKFFSQQKKEPNISDNDLMYPMKNELSAALCKLLNKKPEELKDVPKMLSRIQLFDWLKSTVEIWKTKSGSHQKAIGPWQTIINNVINEISKHNNANEILKAYMETNSPAYNKSLIENSRDYIFKRTELIEKRIECFQTLKENKAKKTTLYYLQKLVLMEIDENDLHNYASALENSPEKYREFVYVWYYLHKLTNEINSKNLISKNLIKDYIPSPTNLQKNENVNLSNCVERCLTDARHDLTSQSDSFVVMWEKEHLDKERKKMWEEIYNKCRDYCMEFYRPPSEDLKEIYIDLKKYMFLTMHHALCVFIGVKDESLLNYGQQILKRSYGGRKGLTLKEAIATERTNAANKIRKHYLSYKKKWSLQPGIYETLKKLIKNLNMSIDDNSSPETLPKTLNDELKTAKSNGQKRAKVRCWLILEQKTLKEEITSENNAIDLALKTAKRTIDECENDLKSLIEETTKMAEKKINVLKFLIWP